MAKARVAYAETIATRKYTQDEIDAGLVINAAVALKDRTKQKETGAAIVAALEGAGLKITVTPWRDAAGIVGLMILLFNVLLTAATVIFTVVSLIIVNNALMMSTLQRTAEIGTMRAIGASRGFIRKLISVEAILLAILFGGAGILAGVGTLAAIGDGIPVTSNMMQFLAGGRKFAPELTLSALLIGIGFTLFSGLFSTIYPTIVATRITPREAMARQD